MLFVSLIGRHYSTPLMPKTPGLESFPGQIIHSHDYREPEYFRDQTVLCLGAAASGMDISIDISNYAKKVLRLYYVVSLFFVVCFCYCVFGFCCCCFVLFCCVVFSFVVLCFLFCLPLFCYSFWTSELDWVKQSQQVGSREREGWEGIGWQLSLVRSYNREEGGG